MELSENRRTALLLVIAILATQILLNGRLQAIWAALWSPAQGLGSGALTGGVQLPAGTKWIQGPGGIWIPILPGSGSSSSTTTTTTPAIVRAPTTSSGNNTQVF